MGKHKFLNLINDMNHKSWGAGQLKKFSGKELTSLAILLGIPHSGTKSICVERIIRLKNLRMQLTKYSNRPEDLIKDFKLKELKEMCKNAKIWRSGNKYALSVSVLNWRNNCRRKGQLALQEARQQVNEQRKKKMNNAPVIPHRLPGPVSFRNRSLAETSIKSYKEGVRQFLNYLKETGQVEGVGSVRAWLEKIKDEKSPATANLRAQGLKEYLLDKYSGDPAVYFGIQELFKRTKRVKVEKSILHDEYLTKGQVDDLSKKMTSRISLIVQALFWTGARISELIKIKYLDVCLDNRPTVRLQGKGGKERTAFFPDRLVFKIYEVFHGRGQTSRAYFFETQGGRPYHRSNLYNEIKRQGKKHGYNISPHTLRHSKAMYLKTEKGLTPDQIAKALGHSSVTTTLESYFHGTPSAEDQGIEP